MAVIHSSFESFAVEYDFMASLNPGRYAFFMNNMSDARDSAIDIGCGSGLLTFELAKHYETVVGIDISEKMLAIARQRRYAPNIKYLLMDANELPLDRKVDLIASASTLHHLDDLASSLRIFKRLLNPNGTIVITDIVSEVQTPATIGYVIGAIRDLVPDILKHGSSIAFRLFRFKTSRAWLRHLASDRFLPEQRFKNICSDYFPGCLFVSSSRRTSPHGSNSYVSSSRPDTPFPSLVMCKRFTMAMVWQS